MNIEWLNDYKIKVKIVNGEVILSLNKEGLTSLANHLMCLAKEDVGSHIHYEEETCLEEGSNSLIIEKIE